MGKGMKPNLGRDLKKFHKNIDKIDLYSEEDQWMKNWIEERDDGLFYVYDPNNNVIATEVSLSRAKSALRNNKYGQD